MGDISKRVSLIQDATLAYQCGPSTSLARLQILIGHHAAEATILSTTLVLLAAAALLATAALLAAITLLAATALLAAVLST